MTIRYELSSNNTLLISQSLTLMYAIIPLALKIECLFQVTALGGTKAIPQVPNLGILNKHAVLQNWGIRLAGEDNCNAGNNVVFCSIT